MSGVHTESNFMTVRQHEVCAKPEGSQSLPLTPEERLTETEGEVTSHTNADGAQTEGMVGTQAQELGRMPEPLVGPETRLLRGRGQAVGGAGVGMRLERDKGTCAPFLLGFLPQELPDRLTGFCPLPGAELQPGHPTPTPSCDPGQACPHL